MPFESLGGLAAVAGLLGLCVGSFLNVVIHRLPKMMEQEWQAQCADLRGETPSTAATLSLARPRSRCPSCGQQITVLENIPLLSYLLLRGKCSNCAAPISPRYPVIEAVTALLSAYAAWHFGPTLQAAGASLVTGGAPASPGCRFRNTLLRVSGDAFLAAPEKLQTEAFGNAALFVVARDAAQLGALVETLEGSLTGGFYTDTRGSDDALYAALEPRLRPCVGRLLNDKMPTGVAVSAAMNHGGPYPSTGHPGFTAVGIPAALRRFAMLQCYDNVRPSRLPALLRDQPPNDRIFRLIDGEWRLMPGVNDLTRNQRQQELLLEALSRLKRFGSIGEFSNLVESLANAFSIDAGLSLREAIGIAWDLRRLDVDAIQRPMIPVADYQTEAGAQVLRPTATFAQVLESAYPGAAALVTED